MFIFGFGFVVVGDLIVVKNVFGLFVVFCGMFFYVCVEMCDCVVVIVVFCCVLVDEELVVGK